MLTEAVKKVLAENLQANGGKISISVYNATSLEGYQIKGTAEHVTSGELVETFKNAVETMFHGAATAKGALTVTPEQIIVTTPGAEKQNCFVSITLRKSYEKPLRKRMASAAVFVISYFNSIWVLLLLFAHHPIQCTYQCTNRRTDNIRMNANAPIQILALLQCNVGNCLRAERTSNACSV